MNGYDVMMTSSGCCSDDVISDNVIEGGDIVVSTCMHIQWCGKLMSCDDDVMTRREVGVSVTAISPWTKKTKRRGRERRKPNSTMFNLSSTEYLDPS